MPLRLRISAALASATVHGPDILEQIVRADCSEKVDDRIELLQDALSQACDIVADLEKAIAAERELAAVRVRA